uniref:Retrotrans_gag domain-containing protein n=1 Tax=Caenorhabditis japonica TaxID=281687 RepID=A0A8R1IPB1_CAEJA
MSRSLGRPGRHLVVASMSQSNGKAPAGPQEDIIVSSQSNVASERNAQQPSINVITQSDSQKAAAAAANKRGTTRSSSPNRRITRAMSASQQPRVNVFAMKSAATVPIFSGTSKENFHAFVRNFKDHVRLTREPDDREVRNHLLTVLTDFARDTAEEVLDRNPDASSDEIIDALRAQYEDQYSTQHRLDAIKACFQYAQEPVQDYYQRIRKLIREAQTGANRSEVIQVAKEAFRTGLQSDIRFYVTTARPTEFDQMYKDAIFFEKALKDKERKERADAAVIANRPRTAEVFAQAATTVEKEKAEGNGVTTDRRNPVRTQHHPTESITASNQTTIMTSRSTPPTRKISPHQPEDTTLEVLNLTKPDFAAPIIVQEVQMPAKQKRHPFDGLYTPREEEEPPKDATKRLVTSIVPAKIHSFRTKSLEWFIPLEKLNTQRILCRFATCSPSNHSQQPTCTTICLLFPRPTPVNTKDIINERFVRSQEGALDKHSFGTSHGSTLVKQTIPSHIVSYSRDICHSFTSDCPDTIDVPQNFANTGDTPSSGTFHRATILIRKSTSFTATQHQSRCS